MSIYKNWVLVTLVLFVSSCKKVPGQKETNANHLINEHSEYLLQHAHNPVDWYPWNNEALEKAKKENKLMIISIGYSSCHWCHVMEHESFSDTAVSRLMNQHFVSIKVDREERPDIDNVYMTACQITNPGGGCGWPLNAITLSDGRPVWVGTYLRKDEWMKLLEQINELYRDDQNELYKMAFQIANHLQADHRFSISEGKIEFDKKTLEKLHTKIIPILDYKLGGKTGDIKFPLPSLIRYAMEYANYSGDQTINNWINTSLNGIMNGGIYDQLAGGFARYSTDSKWKIPHFEKMLYDNAQLISIYANEYKRNPSEEYKILISQTTHFLLSDFSSKDGYYYSSFDADSEGEEGKYYAWTIHQIREIVGTGEAFNILKDLYNLSEAGNWEHGKNILAESTSISELVQKYKMKESDLLSSIQQAKQKLLESRKKRVSPRCDQKMISSWNALMVEALCDVYGALSDTFYLNRALQTANFLKTQMITPEFKMYRSFGAGKKGSFGFLDDYALSIQSFIRLYEVTFDESWLHLARSLCDKVIQNFSDEDKVYFYYNSSEDPELVARKKELSDQVMPASNSVMCDVLHKLGLYFYNEDYIHRSEQMLAGILQHPAAADPVFYSNWLRIQLQFVKPLYEVAIVGKDFNKFQQELLRKFIPNAILLGGASEGGLELLKEKLQEGETFIYVCRNKVCKLPVQDTKKAMALMN